jgi:hypothetical protein
MGGCLRVLSMNGWKGVMQKWPKVKSIGPAVSEESNPF